MNKRSVPKWQTVTNSQMKFLNWVAHTQPIGESSRTKVAQLRFYNNRYPEDNGETRKLFNHLLSLYKEEYMTRDILTLDVTNVLGHENYK